MAEAHAREHADRACTPAARRARRPRCRARPRPSPAPRRRPRERPPAGRLHHDRRLGDGRQPLRRNVERSHDLVAPAPVGDVEEQRPRRVRRVDRPLARHAQAHVVLREHDPVDACVDLGPCRRQSSFGAVKPSARLPVSDERSSPTSSSISAHSAPVLVVPEDRGTQELAVLVEADEPVHLPREPDRRRVGAETRESGLACAPPVLRDPARPSPAAATRGRRPPRPRRRRRRRG